LCRETIHLNPTQSMGTSLAEIDLNSHVVGEWVLSSLCFLSLFLLYARRQWNFLWLLGIGLPGLAALAGSLKFGGISHYHGFDITHLHQSLNATCTTLGIVGLALGTLRCYRFPYFTILSWPILLSAVVAAFFAVTDPTASSFYGLVAQGVSIALMLLPSLYQFGRGHPSAKWVLLSLVLMVSSVVLLEKLPPTNQYIHPIDLFHYVFGSGLFCASLAPRATPKRKQKTR